ncbi:MAG: T9SS type A sorting domain-containing protein [Ignavibacteriales bacterium]|nr:T9SS type A sorting domain-containing protein [Ignavibacteriales bacterium]
MKSKIKFLSVLVLLAATTSFIFGYPGGVSGYTKKSGNAGCSCHGSSYLNTTVLVKITGPDTLAAGATGAYTVRVSGGPSTKAGVDISASVGTLSVVSNLKLLSGELTHSSAKSYVNGGVDFTFKYTAPSAIGTQTLYATGSSKKYWNWAVNKTITVVSATSVNGRDKQPVANYVLNGCYPNPFNNETRVSLYLATGCTVKLNLFDISGRFVKQVFNGNVYSGTSNLPVVMENQAAGIYFAEVSAQDNVTGNIVLHGTQRLVYLK